MATQDPGTTPDAAGTEYVLLRQEIVDGAMGEVRAWVEVARVTADRRPVAFDVVRARHPEVLPQHAGDVERVQLVPARFWNRVKLTARQPEVQVDVEGL